MRKNYKKYIYWLIFYILPYLLPKRRINLLLVGAQKCGTSTLFKTLEQHPEIKGSFVKEVHYFDKNYFMGNFWYHGFFPLSNKRKVKYFIESSPSYITSRFALDRIRNYDENIKIIVILRNRLDRAYSQYRHNLRFRPTEENRGFTEALALEGIKLAENPYPPNSRLHEIYNDKFNYLARSRYYPQLKRLYTLFSKKNILVLDYDKFFSEDLKLELRKLSEFLDLNFQNLNIRNAMVNTEIKERLNSKEKAHLSNLYFRDDIEQCRNLLGIELKGDSFYV